ncbi:Maf family protein [Erythrobacter sp. HA6-11]
MLQSEPIILASKSASRRAMLDAVGVEYEAIPADIDERAVEDSLTGASPSEVAEALAVAKAAAIAADHPDRIVLGSDSLVVCEGRRFNKPQSRDDAAAHLRFFSSKVIELHSGAALLRGQGCEWSGSALAQMHVRELSDAFIESYLEKEWPEVGYCVGVFRIEALGPHLFEQITGDQFTVLGMPLLMVLEGLRDAGVLAR